MNKDLIEKYQRDPSFKHEINVKKEQARKLRNRTKQRDLNIIPPSILCKYPSIQNEIYFYFGYEQPIPKRLLSNVTMYLLKNFHPAKDKPYTFVFFNDLCEDNYILWNFRQTFSFLPIEYLANLKQFIVVKPYLYHRAMDFMTFGALPKYIKSKQIFMNNNTQLCEYLKIAPENLVEIIPKYLYEKQFSHLVGTDITLPKLRYNISGQHRRQQSEEQQQFQRSIKSMIMKPGQQINCLQDYEISQIGVPLILKMLIYYFQAYPQGKKLQGIFRKSVSIDEQNQTINKIMEKNYDYLLEVQNPHVIANLIKKFFVSLKVPIIPFVEFQQLMDDKKVTDKLQHFCQVLQKLPELNLITLMFLANFLCDSIIENEGQNKMSAQNLAICFSPCLLHSKVPSEADLIYAGKAVVYTKFLMTERQKIFGTPQEQQARYRQSYIKSRQDLQNAISLVHETNEIIQNIMKEEPVEQNMKSNRFSRKVQENFEQFDINNFVDEQEKQQEKQVVKCEKLEIQDKRIVKEQQIKQQVRETSELKEEEGEKEQSHQNNEKQNKEAECEKDETKEQTVSKQIQISGE